MVRKVLHVAKSHMRGQNANWSSWQQNFVTQNSYRKLASFWQRNFLPHTLNQPYRLVSTPMLTLFLRTESICRDSCEVTSICPCGAAPTLIQLLTKTNSIEKFQTKQFMVLTQLGLCTQECFINMVETFQLAINTIFKLPLKKSKFPGGKSSKNSLQRFY